MEYYSGILFLTTNIVGIIDEAFKSRIHIALRYDTINLDSTERIWNKILDRIIKDNQHSNVKIKFDRDALLEFAQSHYEKHEADQSTWNARQIRNAFTTAIAMGQFDRLERVRETGLKPDEAATSGKKGLMTIKLTNRNFSKIAKTATEFEEYINTVRGPDADNALASQQRNDYFESHAAQLRRSNWEGIGDQKQGPRRQGYMTPQSPKSAKEKKATKKPINMDEEEDDGDSELLLAKKPPTRKEDFSEDDESDD
jgi:hypothetical protein